MMPLYRCSSIEDWQRKLTFAIRATQADMVGTAEKPGPGRTLPVLFGVDSVMGKQSEEIQESILGKKAKDGSRGKTGKGHAARSFPIEAQIITKYMRTIPGELDNWPFDPGPGEPPADQAGRHGQRRAEQVRRRAAQLPGVVRAGAEEGRRAQEEDRVRGLRGLPGRDLCEKNSFGPTHRTLQTRVLWWEEEDAETGDWSQRTVWDWDWSTVHLLNNMMSGEKANPRLKRKLKDIDFHLACPKVGDVENTAWSKSLGMKEGDAMSWSEVGALIRQDADLMNRLRSALRINRRPLMAGDYLRQIESMAGEMP
jgi:hypothetical protein